MFEIHGNTEGIKDSELSRLQALYMTELDSSEFISRELAESLARITSRINREIALYISRGGDILDIVVGTNDMVKLPDFHLRRNPNALSKVRVIHTHPSGTPHLSDLDLTALTSLHFDAMCALGITQDGQINGICCAFISGWVNGKPQIELSGIYSLLQLSKLNWMDKIIEYDKNLPDATTSDLQPERAVLVAIRDDRSFDELDALARTAGAIPVGRVMQKRPFPDNATYIGSGKVQDLSMAVQTLEADLIIAQDELSGVQIHQLETLTGVRVIDRTTLILDIFAPCARTREGQLQVSLAQLNYQMTHLIGYGLSLSRLGGGIGTRGPGESKLELDRRAIKRRRTQLLEQLETLKKQRILQKKRRIKNEIPTAALIGYTNAGKSTIFNTMTQADVYVQDQLFATLDATTRRIEIDGSAAFLLTDTVGFISHLPTELIEAFQSTLEEAVSADLLLIVTDASDPSAPEQRRVVSETLARLGADRRPTAEILNKCDIAQPEVLDSFPDAIRISALSGQGIEELKAEIVRRLGTVTCNVRFSIPYNEMQFISLLYENAQNVVTDYQPETVFVTAEISQKTLQRLIKSSTHILNYEIIDEK